MTEPRKSQVSDEDLGKSHDARGLRVILAELVESAAHVNVEWAFALDANKANHLDRAMTHLANVTTELGIMEVQIADLRAAAEADLDRLEDITEGGPG
jgi:hypothetical protein